MTIWGVYHSPPGAPAPFLAQRWSAAPGAKPVAVGAVLYAATEGATNELVKGTDEKPGELVWHPRVEGQAGEAKRLIGTWERAG